MTPDGLDALKTIYQMALSRGSVDAETLQGVMSANAELGHALHMLDGEAQATINRAVQYGGTEYGSRFDNGVVVLDLIGPIYPRANMMTMSGACSIQQFTSDFVKAYNDPDVSGIVMNIDSPGGDVRGIGDAAMLMYGLSKKRKKPVKSFASGYMASAAYYIGAIAQEVVGSKSSLSGSIGVVLTARANADGEYEITASQSPYKRVDASTEEGQNVLLEQVNDLCDIFISDAALFRGISSEKLAAEYGQGKVIVGPRAKTMGLIDSIGTLSGVVEEVAKEAQSGSYRKSNNNKRKMSLAVGSILQFSEEDNIDMGLKDLITKFAASNQLVAGVDEEQAPSTPATDESIEAVAGEEGQEVTAGIIPTVPPVITQESREALEERWSDGAELFATQMTVGSKILPAQQAHVASDFLVAKTDDSIIGGTVRYVTAEGAMAEGTREEALRARYEAMPKHTLTQKAIVGVSAGSVVAQVLAEEDSEDKGTEKSGPMSAERRNEVLGATEAGRKILAREKASA